MTVPVSTMSLSETTHLKMLRFLGGSVLSVYKAVLYFLSFLGPVVIIRHFWWLPSAVLLAMAIVGFGIAGLTFLSLLILTKKFLIGPFECVGVETIDSNNAKKWFSAAMLTVILDHSPFRSMICGLSLFASWYYRGMGARMPASAMIGSRALIFDPWFLEAGENVNIGADAMVLGHVGHGKEIVLGRVIIGDRAIVGTRAVIFPEVRIGNDARVAAGAVVVRGTIIPDGEIWAGVPARRVFPKAAGA